MCFPITFTMFEYLLTPMCVIFGLIALAAIIQHVRARVNGTLQQTTAAFYLNLALFVCTFGIYAVEIPVFFTFCRLEYMEMFPDLLYTWTLFQNSSVRLAFAIFFYRLWKIFNGTSFGLSKPVFYLGVLIMVFDLVCLPIIGLSLTYEITDVTLQDFSQATAIFNLITQIWVAVVFILKLFKVYRHVDGDQSGYDDDFIHVVTKVTLLSSISALANLAHIIYGRAGGDPETLDELARSFVWGFGFQIFDVFTTFLCVYLSLQYSEPIYNKLCFCCHSRCNALWTKCRGNASLDASKVKSGTSKDSTATTKDTELTTQQSTTTQTATSAQSPKTATSEETGQTKTEIVYENNP